MSLIFMRESSSEGDGADKAIHIPASFARKICRELARCADETESGRDGKLVAKDIRAIAEELSAFLNQDGGEVPLKGRRIMIVEDNDMNAIVAMKYLGSAGALPVLARSGKEALFKLETAENHPDIILVDIHMPGMDGIELVREIRKRPDLSNTLLFALTSDGSPETRSSALDAGVDVYFQKPVNFSELATVISERLAGSDSPNFFYPQEQCASGGGTQSAETALLSPERATEFIGSKDLYRMAAAAFLKDAFALLTATNRNRKEGNHKDALHNIHSLKGLAGTVGADRLFAELTRVNASMKDGVPISPEDYRKLLSIMGVTVEAIENFLGQ